MTLAEWHLKSPGESIAPRSTIVLRLACRGRMRIHRFSDRSVIISVDRSATHIATIDEQLTAQIKKILRSRK
jgi:hypothetical protein